MSDTSWYEAAMSRDKSKIWPHLILNFSSALPKHRAALSVALLLGWTSTRHWLRSDELSTIRSLRKDDSGDYDGRIIEGAMKI